MGAAAMAYTLWTRHLRFNPKDPHWLDRDRFVLSAGHGVDAALRAAASFRFRSDARRSQIVSPARQQDAGAPEYRRTPGVEATTGPLGQGVRELGRLGDRASAFGARLQRPAHADRRPLHLLHRGRRRHDGRHQRGSRSLAGHLQARQAHRASTTTTTSRSPARPTSRSPTTSAALRSLRLAHAAHRRRPRQRRRHDRRRDHDREGRDDRPSLDPRSARTSASARRSKTPSRRTASRSAPRTSRRRKKSSAGRSSPTSSCPTTRGLLSRGRRQGRGRSNQWKRRYYDWKTANPDLAAQLERALRGEFPADLPWPTFNAENGSVATRDAGGTVMNAIAQALPELVGGSADLDPSTKTLPRKLRRLRAGNYAGRNVHYGVREHGMVAIITASRCTAALAVLPRPSSSSPTTASPRCGWPR